LILGSPGLLHAASPEPKTSQPATIDVNLPADAS
jgi:hypothetical protein